MLHTIETFLPVFPGFYNTFFEPDETSWIEDGKTYDNYRWDYVSYFNDVAKKSCDVIQGWLKELHIRCKINFQRVHSPKEYNFANDAVYIKVKILSAGLDIIKGYLNNNIVTFKDWLKERYTSRSGFISHYSTDPIVWLENMTKEHEFGAILDFILTNEKGAYDVCTELYNAVEPYNIYIENELLTEEENY